MLNLQVHVKLVLTDGMEHLTQFQLGMPHKEQARNGKTQNSVQIRLHFPGLALVSKIKCQAGVLSGSVHQKWVLQASSVLPANLSHKVSLKVLSQIAGSSPQLRL